MLPTPNNQINPNPIVANPTAETANHDDDALTLPRHQDVPAHLTAAEQAVRASAEWADDDPPPTTPPHQAAAVQAGPLPAEQAQPSPHDAPHHDPVPPQQAAAVQAGPQPAEQAQHKFVT